MPNFSVPNQISPGDTSDANKAMANWNQVVNDLNGTGAVGGGKIDSTNTAAAFANGNVEPAFSMWKPILVASGAQSATTTNHLLAPTGSVFQGSAPISPFGPYYFDPAQYTAGSRTTKIRVRAILSTNSVFPGGLTVTASFGSLISTPGASGSDSTYALSAITTSAAFATPAAGLSHQEGAALAAPAAGFYSLSVAASGINANALYDITVILEVQQV